MRYSPSAFAAYLTEQLAILSTRRGCEPHQTSKLSLMLAEQEQVVRTALATVRATSAMSKLEARKMMGAVANRGGASETIAVQIRSAIATGLRTLGDRPDSWPIDDVSAKLADMLPSGTLDRPLILLERCRQNGVQTVSLSALLRYSDSGAP